MILRVPTLEDCEDVRLWRNDSLETLRTPYPLTKEMQADFYNKVISNRFSPHRYWSVVCSAGEIVEFNNKLSHPIGMGGLTYIEWENSQAEISLIINPHLRGKGYGKEAVRLLLDKAFNYLGLNLVYGECYHSNTEGYMFWASILKQYGGQSAKIRKGKYWEGDYYPTMYFDINDEEFNGKNKEPHMPVQ